jgi:hypothetical protein
VRRRRSPCCHLPCTCADFDGRSSDDEVGAVVEGGGAGCSGSTRVC